MKYEGLYWVSRFLFTYLISVAAANLFFVQDLGFSVIISIQGSLLLSAPFLITASIVYFIAYKTINKIYYVSIPVSCILFDAAIFAAYFRGKITSANLNEAGGWALPFKIMTISSIIASVILIAVIRTKRGPRQTEA